LQAIGALACLAPLQRGAEHAITPRGGATEHGTVAKGNCMSQTKQSAGRKAPGIKPKSDKAKARLAEALRENLRRRKVQERARTEGDKEKPQ
jgi:hypothetical protein